MLEIKGMEMMNKLTLPEFMSTLETLDGSVDESWTRHWKQQLPNFLNETNWVHEGDCTKVSCPCMLCYLERVLIKYRKYVFDVKEDEDE